MNISRTSRRSAVLLAIVGVLFVVIGSAQVSSARAGLSKAEYRALLLRSQALNETYGVSASAKPVGMSTQEFQALKLRGQALNRKYGLGGSAVPETQPVTVVGSGSFDWGDFGLGAVAMLGLVLVTSGVVAGGRHVPRARTS